MGSKNNGLSFNNAVKVVGLSMDQKKEMAIKLYNKMGEIKFIWKVKFSFLDVINAVNAKITSAKLLIA